MRFFYSLLVFIISSGAVAATVTPLDESEMGGGAGCYITNKAGKILIDERIKINGKLIELKKKFFTPKSKSWSGADTEVSFTLGRGKMLESSNGDFSIGKTPAGKLVVTHKGTPMSLVAHEECFGAD